MNKTDKLNELATKVISIIGEIEKEEIGTLKTYDIICLVTENADGDITKTTQRLYVENEGLENESAYFGGKQISNYIAPEVSTPNQSIVEQGFLDRLAAIEAELGYEIKVSLSELKELGIKPFVYSDSTNKVKATATLNGTIITREVL